jgi:hypothetical protein
MKLKKQEDMTLWLSHEHVVIFVCIYINALADSVILYLQHDVYNIIFKIIYELPRLADK